MNNLEILKNTEKKYIACGYMDKEKMYRVILMYRHPIPLFIITEKAFMNDVKDAVKGMLNDEFTFCKSEYKHIPVVLNCIKMEDEEVGPIKHIEISCTDTLQYAGNLELADVKLEVSPIPSNEEISEMILKFFKHIMGKEDLSLYELKNG